ncbi:receptor-type tyrosine-protein phosphatase eta isoform 2 precursor [Daubentonia madagascariensis]|uniref:Receptor-type tyrosine-protein phosphatase eta isoform 2 n=1 Tax=Daubentonia madagascariensis TaxID=31869 RepID=A0ABD2FAT7_DAUMA
MKSAAREARLPPRSPGLRWALPLLLLLSRQGQMVCAGDSPGTNYRLSFSNGSSTCCQQVQTKPSPVFDIEAVSISPTNVTLTWKNNDTAASEYVYRVKNEMEQEPTIPVANQTRCNITGLSPATSYTFSITPGIGSGTWGDPRAIDIMTEPSPVSGLRVAFVGMRKVAVSWSNDNGTASCRMLLEDGSREELTQGLAVNISGLKPGGQYNVTLYLPESNETRRGPLVTESGLDANSTERSPAESWPQPRSSPTSPVHDENLLGHADPSFGRQSRDTDILLVGLKPGTQYKATVYSQAADGTEGQPQAIEFRTNASRVYDVTLVNISATSMTLTWKISDNESSSVYTYEVHVAGEDNSLCLNETVNETHAVISGLSSSTFYNITVHPFLGDAEGTPGFLQVYTPPGPVSDFQVTMVGTREIGLAWSSNDSDSFKINITQDGAGKSWVKTTTNQSIVIDGLYPGTKYRFEIFPQGPNGTEGISQTVYNRTG